MAPYMNNKQTIQSVFSITELSQELGITTRSLRHYEDIGLISPKRQGQTRIYSPADRTKLMLILRGKRLGFSLEESREIIDMYNPSKGNKDQLEKLIQCIGVQKAKLKQQKEDINKMMRDLKDAEDACLRVLGKKASGEKSQEKISDKTLI
jgi:DNA-binding transcriptional MerR regulator